jgi:hypothetical protein
LAAAFEFAALEIIFMSAAAITRREVLETAREARQVLDSVRQSLSSRLLSRVLRCVSASPCPLCPHADTAAADARASGAVRCPACRLALCRNLPSHPTQTDVGGVGAGRLKKRLAQVQTTVSACQDAFEEVQDDHLLPLLYLTALQEDAALLDARLRAGSWNTDEAELLLDSYAQDMASMLKQLKAMEQEIEATEALLKLKLDTARNNLIKVDVSFGVAALWITACSVISGYYGMNLVNGHEGDTDLIGGSTGPSRIWLEVVLISSCGASALIVTTLLTLWCCGLFQS